MQSTQLSPQAQAPPAQAPERAPTHPQVLIGDVWRDVRALHEYCGGRGYETYWWTLDDAGRVSMKSIGYSDHTFRRMLGEGRARFQSETEREAWADAESVRRLEERERAERADDRVPAQPKSRRYASAGHRLHALLGAHGVEDHYAAASAIVGREVTSLNALSLSEVELVEGSYRAEAPASR